MVNETRRRWLSDYQRELSSGKWGHVLSIWFDEPLDGNVPWEPCAVVERNVGGRTVYVVLTEDYTADPRRLEEYAKYDIREAAYARIERLRPWNLRASWGYSPSVDEWKRWLKEYSNWAEMPSSGQKWPCGYCGGEGTRHCPECDDGIRRPYTGHFYTCPACNGTATVTCRKCGGGGYEIRE